MATARQTYRDEATREARDELVLNHLALVRRILARLVVDFPTGVDLENLQAAGVLGLMQAACQFDPSRGTDFRQFAKQRIRGEILDELRRNSPLPQRILKNISRVRRTMERLGFDAGFEEIALNSGLSTTEIDEAIQAMRVANTRNSDEYDFLMHGVFDRNADRPEKRIEHDDLKNVLKEAIQGLPEKERLVVTLYHYEELTLKEIGEVLELSESRISRLLNHAEFRLNRAIHKRIQ